MVDWSRLPDVGAVALLTAAFSTVARRSRTTISPPWLTGWVMIAVHFTAQLFSATPGFYGNLADFIAVGSLASAGLLFTWASVPYRNEASSRQILFALLFTNTIYVGIVTLAPAALWLLPAAAVLYGITPLTVALSSKPRFGHRLRYVIVLTNVALSFFLLAFQNRPEYGPTVALNAILFTIYLSCCIHFVYAFRPSNTGVFVTAAGFLTWASVFVIGPSLATFFPAVQIESEVWNLPKYVVAVGMILVLLEQQIEHNKHLALHDDLTGLPNRRLFHDRLSTAIERARRTGSRTALLLIDLDRFKQVNDSVGHHAGDQVLKQVSQVLVSRVRRCDTVARTGGDEFSIILEEPVSRQDAEHVSRSLIDLLHQSLALDGHTICIGASIGLALYPEDAATIDALRVAADVSMYAQKNISRRWEFEKPLGPRVSDAEPEAKLEARNTA